MANVGVTAPGLGTGRDHGFHPVRIGRVVRETADTRSFTLEVPEALRPAFAYQAGQFCTFRVWIGAEPYIRCYSMSSSPAVDAELRVTVKRVPGGAVSNWMIDTLTRGRMVEVAPPAGYFLLGPDDRDLVAFGAGSGITPVFSLVKTALATTSRRVRLLYANRDPAAAIFGPELDALAGAHANRFELRHHFDVERGFVGPGDVRPFAAAAPGADFYICGPGPFMDIAERALLEEGVDGGRIHIERFTPVEHRPGAEPPEATSAPARITIELGGRTDAAEHHPGTTILQMARQMGMSPPSSCESGSCATCMAKLVEGSASMHVNNALTPDEVDDGWVLTCQALPTSPSVHVVYGYEDR